MLATHLLLCEDKVCAQTQWVAPLWVGIFLFDGCFRLGVRFVVCNLYFCFCLLFVCFYSILGINTCIMGKIMHERANIVSNKRRSMECNQNYHANSRTNWMQINMLWNKWVNILLNVKMVVNHGSIHYFDFFNNMFIKRIIVGCCICITWFLCFFGHWFNMGLWQIQKILNI